MRKTALAGLLTLLLFFGVLGCDLFGTTTTTSTTTASITTTTTSLPASDTTVSTTQSQLEVRLLSIYQLAVSSGAFTGTYEEWLESVRGPAGREIALRVSGGFVQWQYAGETAWNDLVALSALVGPAGLNGQTPTFRVSGTKLQWQLPGAASWTDLFDLSVLTGTPGSDAGEIALRVEGGFLQWQREGDLLWTSLIDLSTLVTQPTISISTDGFWVINGVKTDYPATAQVIPQTVSVTFDPNGGTMPAGFALTIQVPKGDAIDLPIPTKDGYLFLGWITGEGIHDIRYNNYTPFVRDTTLHAVWKQDNEALLAFLAAPLSMNYSGRKTLLVRANVDDSFVMFIETSEMKIMQKDGRTYRTYLDLERELEGEIFVVRHREEGFEQIESIETNVLAQAYKFQFYDGRWNLRAEWGQVKNETGFELFDPALFVKRPGERKYDYPITDEQLKLYGIPVGDEVVLSKKECYLDLDRGEFVIELEGQAKMDTESYHPVTASLRLALYDAGTTVIEVPMAAARENVREEIEAWTDAVMTRWEYLAAFPSSKQAFANLVDGFLMEIANADDLADLLVLRQTAEPAILYFQFEYNFLELQKSQRIQEIKGHLDWQCGRSTAESCDAMRAYFETAKAQIQSANDESALQSAVMTIYDGIRSRFVESPEALALQMHKERLKEFADVCFEVLLPYLTNQSIQMEVRQRIGQTKTAIDYAFNIVEADMAYNNLYPLLMDLQIFVDDWSQAKTFLLAQNAVWGTWIDTLATAGYDLPQGIKAQFEQDYAMLGGVPELLLMIRLSIETYVKYEIPLMPFVRQWGLAALATSHDAAVQSVPPDLADEVEQAYASAQQRIQTAKGPWDVQAAIDDFLQVVANLPEDTWQDLVAAAKGSLQVTIVQLMELNPDAASQEAMIGLIQLGEAELALVARGDETALQNAADKWRIALQKAFYQNIPDYDAFELFRWRARATEMLDRIYFTTKSMIEPGQNLTALDAWKVNYEAALLAATTVAQTLSVRQDATNAWLNMSFVYKPDFESYRQNYLAFVDGVYGEAILHLGVLPQTLETSFASVRNQLTNQTNPQYLIMSGASAMDILPYSVRIAMQDAFFPRLLDRRNTWADLVSADQANLLQSLYQVAFTKINRAWSPAEVPLAFAEFESLANLLPKDPFKMARFQAVHDFHAFYEKLAATSAPDSLALLSSIHEIGVGQIQNSLTLAEVAANLAAAQNALQAAYVMDDALWQLDIYRGYYREVGKRIVETILAYASNPEMGMYLRYSYEEALAAWALDTTQESMYASYLAWLEVIKGLGYQFDIPLSTMIAQLNVGLANDYAMLFAKGVAGDPVLIETMSYWNAALGESMTHVDAIANRHMGYYSALDRTYVILYESAVLQLQSLLAHHQGIVPETSLALLQDLYEDALYRIKTNPDRFDHTAILHDFETAAAALS